jgi:hypothetical protein
MTVKKRALLHSLLGLAIAAISATGFASGRTVSMTTPSHQKECLDGGPGADSAALPEPARVEAQSCPHIPAGGGEDLQAFITKADGSCTVENGSYVRSWTSYKLHVLAEANGQCTTRKLQCSPSPCVCVTIETQLRKPSGVGILLYNLHPLSPFSIGPIYPNDNSLQQWDSRVPGQTSPPGRTWSTYGTLGEATLRFTEIIYTTACNILPNEKVIEKTAYVLQCEPRLLNDNGNVPHLAPPPPPDKVEVYLDPATMSTAATPLDEAILDWKNLLGGTGVVFERTGTDCGSGPHCIRVAVGPISSCGFASWDPPDPNTGLWTGGLLVELHSSWSTFSPASLRRTFVHELGHFLGLDNYTSATGCGVDDAIMRDDFVCGPTASPGVAITGGDALPVVKSTYGGGTKTTCGW